MADRLRRVPASRFATAIALTFRGLLALAVASGGALAQTGCVRGLGKSDAVPMGSWPAWQDLSPLLEVAEPNVEPTTYAILEAAREELRAGRPRAADAILAKGNRGAGRHWIAVARGDLASLYFGTCIRGVAWRLPEDIAELQARGRSMDWDPETRVEPGDLSVEALLTNLDDAVEAGKQNPVLLTQARIARVRVAGYAASCPANPEVERRAAAVMNADLATLAAEHHLTPDLAYMWAGVQLQSYSGAAARPFLVTALEGGFEDPAVRYMLAVIAYEQGELAEADELAEAAASVYVELGDPGQGAECVFLRGEIARAAQRWDDARGHYGAALEQKPGHVGAMLGLAATELDRGEELGAAELLAAQLRVLTRGEEELDERSAAALVDDLEALIILANADTFELVQVTRLALLTDIDAEPDPFRRGLRYFYAATLEVRMGDYESARGHAVTAATEFEDSWLEPPDKANPRAFLDRLAEAAG